METGKQLILKERLRQFQKEGWSFEHDDTHINGELARAADCYYYYAEDNDYTDKVLPEAWPWDAAWWKPKNQLADYTRAGALYKAEIDRLERSGNGGHSLTDARIGLRQCESRIDLILNNVGENLFNPIDIVTI